MATFLKDGSPSSWYAALCIHSPGLLEDFNAFIKDFESHFEATNPAHRALEKLEHLYQTSSASAYASQFREQLPYLDFSEQTKIATFRRHLKEEVKDLLVNIWPSAVFDEFVEQVIEIDNQLFEREQEKKRRHHPGSKYWDTHHDSPSCDYHPASPEPLLAPSTSPEPVPMEVDAMQRRLSLTPEEKLRRRHEGLCLYYGAGKHFIANCPNMSEYARNRFAYQQTKSSSLVGKD